MVKGCNGIKGSIEWGRNKRKALFPVFRLDKQAIKDFPDTIFSAIEYFNSLAEFDVLIFYL